jgi:hypothetical protein
VLTVYLSSNAFLKCSTFFLPIYLTPKSSMTSVNVTGRVSCFDRTGVLGMGAYPWLASRCWRRSCASFPACGSPYIPPRTSMYTQSLYAIARRLYWLMIYLGMSEMLRRMYLYSFMGVPT